MKKCNMGIMSNRDHAIVVRVTDAERRDVTRQAKAVSMPVALFVRAALGLQTSDNRGGVRAGSGRKPKES